MQLQYKTTLILSCCFVALLDIVITGKFNAYNLTLLFTAWLINKIETKQ
jgi:hypothetical protein